MTDANIVERLSDRARVHRLGAAALLLLIVLGATATNSVACVSTGHVGVVTLFGRVTGRAMGEGIHLVNPVARVHELDIKTQEIKERASVPSQEGLIMGLEASVLYHLAPGPGRGRLSEGRRDYADVLLIPNFRSSIRAVTASNTASELYSDSREAIARQILDELRASVQPRGILVENVLLRDLQLPETLKTPSRRSSRPSRRRSGWSTCSRKRSRKRSASASKRPASRTSRTSSPRASATSCCEWKGIEATIELARSSNSKVIVVGNPKTGLPLIYATDK